MYSYFQTFKSKSVRNDRRDSDLIPLPHPFHLHSLYLRLEKRISSGYYGSSVCGGASIIGSNFWPLSSSEHIPLVLTDYYILDNNSLLKAALKYKRIQLTDFRTVSMEHFGENERIAFRTFAVNHKYIGNFYNKYIFLLCFS